MEDIEALVKQLEEWDDAYFFGAPLVSDAEYDQLHRKVLQLAPKHAYFTQQGSKVRGGKIPLPYPMNGLEQVFENQIEAWVKKNNHQQTEFLVTDKLDGTSALLVYKRGRLAIAYSRGNDALGADITRHVVKNPSVPKTTPTTDLFVVRGEMIMRNDTFASKYAKEFANPRSMVAGSMNRSDTYQSVLDDIHFIAYHIVEGPKDIVSKEESLAHLEILGFNTPPRQSIVGSQLNDKKLADILAEARAKSPYELDGIVLTDNYSVGAEESIKYKVLREDDIVEADVVAVLWEISKSGWFKPRVQIKPVNLFGTTVTYATGFNAKFIFDNGIGPGARVRITKSGSVIPYILGVTRRVAPQMPPAGEWDWNATKVEAVVVNHGDNETVRFKQALDFFTTLDVELLKEASFKIVFDTYRLGTLSFAEAVTTVLGLMEPEWVNLIGVNGSKIYTSLQRKAHNLPLATFLGGTPFFGVGFGVRKAKALLENGAFRDIRKMEVDEIARFDGFDIKTATQVRDGIGQAATLLYDLVTLDLIKIAEIAPKGNALKGMNVVFTGFRDKDLEERIEKAGGKIGSSVSSKTTHLLTLTPGSGSSKLKKASELGVKVLTPDEFKDEFNL